MFKPLIFYIGLRYTRAKRRTQFISFITLTSVLGIALGVTALITVLSVMNGFEALEEIKAIRPKLIVIAQTAYSSSEEKEKIFKAGFYGYITKPINREKLFEIIDEVFRNKK